MSIADKITRLQNSKTAIANAITGKGGTVGAGDGFEDFATAIGNIPSGGGTVSEIITNPDHTFENNDNNFIAINDSRGFFYPCDNDGQKFQIRLRDKTEFRFLTKFKLLKNSDNAAVLFGWDYGNHFEQLPSIGVKNPTKIFAGTSFSGTHSDINIYDNVTIGEWYYGVVYWNSDTTKEIVSLYDKNGTYITHIVTNSYDNYWYNSTIDNFCYGGCFGSYNQYFSCGCISMNECFIEINNELIWGHYNSKTQNMGKITDIS